MFEKENLSKNNNSNNNDNSNNKKIKIMMKCKTVDNDTILKIYYFLK